MYSCMHTRHISSTETVSSSSKNRRARRCLLRYYMRCTCTVQLYHSWLLLAAPGSAAQRPARRNGVVPLGVGTREVSRRTRVLSWRGQTDTLETGRPPGSISARRGA
jgi:hypothetical protein